MADWLLFQDGVVAYLSLFILLLGSTIGFPPEDLVLIFAGVIAHRGNGQLAIIFLVCYLGILVGDLIIFSIGRRLGPKLFEKPWFKKRIHPSKISKVRVSLERRSLAMIFLARHLLYLRTVTFITCGAVKMGFGRFLIADAVAALISAPLMMGLGFVLSENADVALGFVETTKSILLLLLAITAFLALYIRRRMRRANAALGEAGTAPPANDNNSATQASHHQSN